MDGRRASALRLRWKDLWLNTSALLKRATHCKAPSMPAMAQQARIEGQVLVDILVDTKGKVSYARLTGGHPLLAASAIDAANDWKLRPVTHHGKQWLLLPPPIPLLHCGKSEERKPLYRCAWVIGTPLICRDANSSMPRSDCISGMPPEGTPGNYEAFLRVSLGSQLGVVLTGIQEGVSLLPCAQADRQEALSCTRL